MDLRLLREETRPEHEATEALMPLMGADLGLPLYLRVLQVLYSVVRGWEQWAVDAAPPDLRSLVAARSRSHFLAADLRFFQATPDPSLQAVTDWNTVQGVNGIPSQGDRASFLGRLYVMEGSTLGGRFIARHLEQVLHLTPGQGNAYFAGHGDQTGPMWREVTTHLAMLPDKDAPITIAAARHTFQRFGQALRTGLQPIAAQG